MSENEKETVATPVVETTEKEIETTKPVETTPAPEAITLPKEESEGPGLAPVANGAIGSTTVKGKSKPEVKETKPAIKETVALFSPSSYHWAENGGNLNKGYNIVDKARADKWLTLSGVRLATPEEVAKAFDAGK